MNIDFAGLGQFLLGVSAIAGVIVNWRSNVRTAERIQEVHIATNGMSEKLQDLARERGFKAGHEAADEEASRRDK